MEIPDPSRIARIVLVSLLTTIPLFTWVFLGGSGGLGAFGETGAFRSIAIGAAVVTVVLNSLVLPVFYWPRVLNGGEDGKRVLRRGKAARGTIRSLSEPTGIPVRSRKGCFIGVRVSVEVEQDGGNYLVSSLVMVPDSLAHTLREGMELPLRVSRKDRMNIAPDWKAYIAGYLGGGVT